MTLEGKEGTVQQSLSEFLGTYFLVLTVGLNVLGSSPAPALSIAASLMVMIYALASSSGAHFNPAVTVALTLAGKAVPLQPGAGHSWSDAAFAEIMYTFVLCFV